jgi:hypothetical protein
MSLSNTRWLKAVKAVPFQNIICPKKVAAGGSFEAKLPRKGSKT